MCGYRDTTNPQRRIPIRIPVDHITSLKWVQQLFNSSVQLRHFVKVSMVQSYGFLSLVADTMF